MADDIKEKSIEIKVVLVGSSGVGKTCMLRMYVCKKYDNQEKPTIGVEFRFKPLVIDKKRVHAHLWDTTGSERFLAVPPVYYRDALGALLVYDITDRDSFEKLDFWKNQINAHANPETIVTLIGNKVDLKDKRTIPFNEALNYARKNNMDYIETSALDSTNIDDAFAKLIQRVFRTHQEAASVQDDPNQNSNAVIRLQNIEAQEQTSSSCFAAKIPLVGRFFQ